MEQVSIALSPSCQSFNLLKSRFRQLPLLCNMELKLFGVAKEIVGSNKLFVAAENFATVGELKQWLSQQYPKLQQLRSMAVAVNSEYAEDNQSLQGAHEIALIPPVSGG